MAIYHFSVSSVSRKAGQSSVRSAAYITGTRPVDERTGRIANYTRKAKEVLETGPFGPIDWQAVEKAEKRKDAKVARSIIVALPHELKPWMLNSLVSGFVSGLRSRHGVAGEWAIHAAPGDKRNIHAHILMTTRQVDDWGGIGHKLRPLDRPVTSRPILKRWRKGWEEALNDALDQNYIDARVDCRSLAARGIYRPTRKHLGPESARRHLLGYPTERGNHNARVDEIERANAELARARWRWHDAVARERRLRQINNARRIRRAKTKMTLVSSLENSSSAISRPEAVSQPPNPPIKPGGRKRRGR